MNTNINQHNKKLLLPDKAQRRSKLQNNKKKPLLFLNMLRRLTTLKIKSNTKSKMIKRKLKVLKNNQRVINSKAVMSKIDQEPKVASKEEAEVVIAEEASTEEEESTEVEVNTVEEENIEAEVSTEAEESTEVEVATINKEMMLMMMVSK